MNLVSSCKHSRYEKNLLTLYSSNYWKSYPQIIGNENLLLLIHSTYDLYDTITQWVCSHLVLFTLRMRTTKVKYFRQLSQFVRVRKLDQSKDIRVSHKNMGTWSEETRTRNFIQFSQRTEDGKLMMTKYVLHAIENDHRSLRGWDEQQT